jgi:hypothetical protein
MNPDNPDTELYTYVVVYYRELMTRAENRAQRNFAVAQKATSGREVEVTPETLETQATPTCSAKISRFSNSAPMDLTGLSSGRHNVFLAEHGGRCR